MMAIVDLKHGLVHICGTHMERTELLEMETFFLQVLR